MLFVVELNFHIKGSPVKLVLLSHLVSFMTLHLHHLIKLVLYHSSRMHQLFSFHLALHIPLLLLFSIILMNLLVLLHPHLTFNPLLVVPQILLKIFKLPPLFTTLQNPLALSLFMLFSHHLIVLEHAFLHHHVHVLLQKSASLFQVIVIIQLLLHLDLLLFRL
jgi:hypothetical protein